MSREPYSGANRLPSLPTLPTNEGEDNNEPNGVIGDGEENGGFQLDEERLEELARKHGLSGHNMNSLIRHTVVQLVRSLGDDGEHTETVATRVKDVKRRIGGEEVGEGSQSQLINDDSSEEDDSDWYPGRDSISDHDRVAGKSDLESSTEDDDSFEVEELSSNEMEEVREGGLPDGNGVDNGNHGNAMDDNEEDDDATYRTFVSTIGQEHVRLEDEEDGEYDYIEDEGEEEREIEEYRNDRAVRISKKEANEVRRMAEKQIDSVLPLDMMALDPHMVNLLLERNPPLLFPLEPIDPPSPLSAFTNPPVNERGHMIDRPARRGLVEEPTQIRLQWRPLSPSQKARLQVQLSQLVQLTTQLHRLALHDITIYGSPTYEPMANETLGLMKDYIKHLANDNGEDLDRPSVFRVTQVEVYEELLREAPASYLLPYKSPSLPANQGGVYQPLSNGQGSCCYGPPPPPPRIAPAGPLPSPYRSKPPAKRGRKQKYASVNVMGLPSNQVYPAPSIYSNPPDYPPSSQLYPWPTQSPVYGMMGGPTNQSPPVHGPINSLPLIAPSNDLAYQSQFMTLTNGMSQTEHGWSHYWPGYNQPQESYQVKGQSTRLVLRPPASEWFISEYRPTSVHQGSQGRAKGPLRGFLPRRGIPLDLSQYQHVFDSQLLPRYLLTRVPTDSWENGLPLFSVVEDRLLVCGLSLVGPGEGPEGLEWYWIHKHCLPCYTANQIFTRHKNLVARKAKANLVREWRENDWIGKDQRKRKRSSYNPCLPLDMRSRAKGGKAVRPPGTVIRILPSSDDVIQLVSLNSKPPRYPKDTLPNSLPSLATIGSHPTGLSEITPTPRPNGESHDVMSGVQQVFTMQMTPKRLRFDQMIGANELDNLSMGINLRKPLEELTDYEEEELPESEDGQYDDSVSEEELTSSEDELAVGADVLYEVEELPDTDEDDPDYLPDARERESPGVPHHPINNEDTYWEEECLLDDQHEDEGQLLQVNQDQTTTPPPNHLQTPTKGHQSSTPSRMTPRRACTLKGLDAKRPNQVTPIRTPVRKSPRK